MANYPWEVQSKYPQRGVSSNGMDIVENPDTNPVLIGHTLAWCSELENALNEALTKAESYFDELVNAGLRQRAKTQEDLTIELLQSLTNTVQTLCIDVSELKKNGGGKVERKPSAGNGKTSTKQGQSKGGAGAGQPAISAESDTSI